MAPCSRQYCMRCTPEEDGDEDPEDDEHGDAPDRSVISRALRRLLLALPHCAAHQLAHVVPFDERACGVSTLSTQRTACLNLGKTKRGRVLSRSAAVPASRSATISGTPLTRTGRPVRGDCRRWSGQRARVTSGRGDDIRQGHGWVTHPALRTRPSIAGLHADLPLTVLPTYDHVVASL